MGLSTKLLLAISILADNCCSSNYKEYDLHNDSRKVCDGKYSFHDIEVKEDKSVLVRYTLTPDDKNDRVDFPCNIHIKTPKMGVFAVIQEMNFRRDPRTRNCTDYIQFRHSVKTQIEDLFNVKLYPRGSWSKQICGEVVHRQEPYTDNPPLPLTIAPHAFQDKKGFVETKIYISKKKLKPGEKIYFTIAFTAYKECENETEDYKLCGNNTCIPKIYFNDKVVNCPFIRCVDEDCTVSPEETESLDLQAEIATAAVLSVVVSFVIFLTCILLCRYIELFELCCGGRSRSVIEGGTELSQVEVEPSAPLDESPDKDLPPPYETLFPERTSSTSN